MPLCQCGCGESVTQAKLTDARRGVKRGDFNRFLKAHYRRPRKESSYRSVRVKASGSTEAIHRLRAEQALGRPLPKGVVVHHADGSRNELAPLVICPSHAYHKLLHIRMRVANRGGNPNTDKICSRCRSVKSMSDFPKKISRHDGLADVCKSCACISAQRQRDKKRALSA